MIFGLGGVGLSALLAANLVGAGEIVAIDTNLARSRPVASRLGATRTVNGGIGRRHTMVRDPVTSRRRWPDFCVWRRVDRGESAGVTLDGRVRSLLCCLRYTRRGPDTTVTARSSASRNRINSLLPAVLLAAEERILGERYVGIRCGSCSRHPTRTFPFTNGASSPSISS